MNTHANKEQQARHAAAAHASEHAGPAPQFNDQRPQATLQRKWQTMAGNSPRVQQLKAYQNIADQALQRMGDLEEEEPLQGKFETLQRVGGLEEEELLQGKFETLQRMGGLEEEEPLQGKFKAIQRMGSLEEEEPLQGKFQPVQRRENNTGLPDNIKSGIENLSGMALDDVQVHYNSPRPAPLQAHAFTQGTDIHVATGQEKHLAHEAWHVVQQKQGRVQPTMSLNGEKINDSPNLEKEADDMGRKAESGA